MEYLQALSRDEMRNIMAGVYCCDCLENCNNASGNCIEDCVEKYRGTDPHAYGECINDCETVGDDCSEKCPSIN